MKVYIHKKSHKFMLKKKKKNAKLEKCSEYPTGLDKNLHVSVHVHECEISTISTLLKFSSYS